MPISISPEQRALLRSGALSVRTLIDFYLDSGRYSFWDGDENWTFDGAQYLAASQFGEIGVISTGQDLGAEGLEVRLNGTALLEANPDAGDPAALFGTFEQENYVMRRVDIRFAFFHAETGALVLLIRRYAGYVDQARQVEEIGDDGRVTSWLVIALESIARRYGVRGARTRSHDDQQEIWPGDEGLKYTANAVLRQGSFYWGRWPPGQGGPFGPGRTIGLPGMPGITLPGG